MAASCAGVGGNGGAHLRCWGGAQLNNREVQLAVSKALDDFPMFENLLLQADVVSTLAPAHAPPPPSSPCADVRAARKSARITVCAPARCWLYLRPHAARKLPAGLAWPCDTFFLRSSALLLAVPSSFL